MKYSRISVPAFLPKLLGQIVGGCFANERLAATRRTVEQKTFRRGMLKFLEKIGMQQRQLDRVFDRLERRLLAADLFPRQLWHSVEIMFVGFCAGEHLQRHPVIRIDANFVARF